LPDNFKINNRQQKILLKDINKKYIPEELMQRLKQGFGIPIFEWFRKELKPILEYYLSDVFVTKQGIFNENMVAMLKLNYLKGDNKNFEFLWFLICFQMWHEKWLEK
jgi:asparagine synthase (glutamine-hydrolysing)